MPRARVGRSSRRTRRRCGRWGGQEAVGRDDLAQRGCSLGPKSRRASGASRVISAGTMVMLSGTRAGGLSSRQDVMTRWRLLALATLVLALGFVGYVRLRAVQADRIVEVLGLQPGMSVADVGAGRGDWSVELARVVGPEGRVFATEIDEGRLDDIERASRRAGLDNIRVIKAETRDTGLPEACLRRHPGAARLPPPDGTRRHARVVACRAASRGLDGDRRFRTMGLVGECRRRAARPARSWHAHGAAAGRGPRWRLRDCPRRIRLVRRDYLVLARRPPD